MTSIHSLIHGVLGRWLAEPVSIAVALMPVMHVLAVIFSIIYHVSFITSCVQICTSLVQP